MVSSAERLAARRRTVASTAVGLRRLWSELDPSDVGGSWAFLEPAAVELVSRGQAAAATGATEYVTDSVAAYEAVSRPAGRVAPAAFAGTASDGRPLETLLRSAPLRTLRARSAGVAPSRSAAAGFMSLLTHASTQIHDAGRSADQVAMTADLEVTRYVRQLRGTSCSRCIVLAGRIYRYSAGFQRHPNCDCVHVPVPRVAKDRSGGPEQRDVFGEMSETEQDRVFGRAGAQALRDGADMGQVVNARSGMKTVRMYGKNVHVTTVGTAKGSLAHRRLTAAGASTERTRALTSTTALGERRRVTRVAVPRITPEQIYADAVDRTDAIRLLKRFGYLV